MEYSKEFIELLSSSKDKLVGWGNPNAKILIVGKESAIPKAKKGDYQYAREIVNNHEDWNNNVYRHLSQNDVKPIIFREGSDIIDNIEDYNPLYPYKGQRFQIHRGNKSKEGTSKTWYQYQKLWNLISGKPSKFIDFHEHCFSTELSVATAKYSSLVDKDLRKTSIAQRQVILSLPFFQAFPIVILPVGHYPNTHNIDLETIFKVKWDGSTKPVDKFWYNVHHSITNSPKLLIHTNQLSMVSDALIQSIAEQCRDFL